MGPPYRKPFFYIPLTTPRTRTRPTSSGLTAVRSFYTVIANLVPTYSSCILAHCGEGVGGSFSLYSGYFGLNISKHAPLIWYFRKKKADLPLALNCNSLRFIADQQSHCADDSRHFPQVPEAPNYAVALLAAYPFKRNGHR